MHTSNIRRNNPKKTEIENKIVITFVLRSGDGWTQIVEKHGFLCHLTGNHPWNSSHVMVPHSEWITIAGSISHDYQTNISYEWFTVGKFEHQNTTLKQKWAEEIATNRGLTKKYHFVFNLYFNESGFNLSGLGLKRSMKCLYMIEKVIYVLNSIKNNSSNFIF